MGTETKVAEAADQHGSKRILVGKVTSTKMQKTIVVEVVRSVKHPVYGKYVRRRKKYKAHDETQQYQLGDVVEIRESRPMSRDKRWTAVNLVRRPAAS